MQGDALKAHPLHEPWSKVGLRGIGRAVLAFRNSQSNGGCRETTAGKYGTEGQVQWRRRAGAGA